ncbi:histidine phosphatase family protein [Paenibacillus daejeonensis]|uniref:histidine phosphatase family protein n=1 Tax=Paenibacillus daejeonensis TaxID=135193 RepID=UPI00035FD036|nr:histidine phosphatase family protein [Paenibacillus daejeonensis]
MQILLIRHGESEADLLKVHEGRADFPLTDRGRQQAKLMAERVKSEFPPDSIWASPLKRASETASTLAAAIGCSVQYEDDLMEYNNGRLAGLSYEATNKPPIPKFLHEQVEQGESAIEFRMRIESVFSRIITSSNDNRIAIVAHGGVINNILRSFFKMPVNQEFWFKNGDTALHLIEISENTQLVHFLNNVSHLDELDNRRA